MPRRCGPDWRRFARCSPSSFLISAWRLSFCSSRRFAAPWRGSDANGGWARAFTRRNPLTRACSRWKSSPSGVPLEALLSRDLLLSIFQPGLPLHDGAVIVQKGRVAAAACFLPLTTNPALSRTLGTRHRAAIGITEETDCLSIVISEESGRISVASFGELTQGLSVDQVEERINLHFDVRRPAQENGPEPGDGRPAEKAALP